MNGLLFYMLFIHSPIEFYLVNVSEFSFIFSDFAWLFIWGGIAITLILSAVGTLIKGKTCDVIACAIFALSLCMYIQLNFMNTSLGLLDGTEKSISSTKLYINLIIWAVIFLLPFIMFFVLKKYRNTAIMFVSAALVVMQISSLTVQIAKSPESAFKRTDSAAYYLSSDDQFTVSSDKNIIVLVLDTYSNSYIDEFFEIYPEIGDVVKDFTYYSNTDCHYEGSFFSLSYIMTGAEYDTTVSLEEWGDEAWNNERNDIFYEELHEQNFIFNVYTGEIINFPYSAKISATGKISNLRHGEFEYIIDKYELFSLFANADVYRFSPLILKPYFEFMANDYYGVCQRVNLDSGADEVNEEHMGTNEEFYYNMVTDGLKTDSEHNYYIIQHLWGVHPPYKTDENCNGVPNSTLLQNERGCWRLVEEYINQLKTLGVYDDATIIITADHGQHNNYYNGQVIFFIKTPGETHDELQTTNAPISFTDLMPTVISLAGGDSSSLGSTIFDFGEDELRERSLFIRMHADDFSDVTKNVSTSSPNCFFEYTYTGDIEDLREVGENGPTEVVPWYRARY